jgi:hypothetical protein
MVSRRFFVLIGLAGSLASVSAADEQSVRPAGVFPLVLPGQSVSPGAPAKAHLWCQGANLVGIVVPNEKAESCNGAAQKRPSAVLLRDGRCEPDGSSVSFGFLLSRKAWVYEASGREPEERTLWLLHRFEGSLAAGQLKGALVQVDVNHPGYSFQKTKVEAEALPGSQAPFADSAAWRSGLSQTYCLAMGEP